ncbi:MAG: protein kinase domain-containing protein, partial [Polyangiaceae bacterium]
NLDRPLALKLIARELSQDPMTIARFRREAQSLATIRHQHVVQVYAYGPHDGTYFFAMEFIDGHTLDHLLTEREHQLPLDQIAIILRAVASGLGAVHEKGLVHRDVKPGNIVIEFSTGRPVLVDFGLAANVRPTDGRTSFVGGTPYYMAPEQIRAGDEGAEPPGPAADQYALACMAYELLTGHPVFESKNVSAILAGHLHRLPPMLSDSNPDLAPIDAPLQRALAKKPEERFESCEAFIAALEPALGAVTSAPMPTGSMPRLVLASTTDTGKNDPGKSDPNPTLDPAALHAALPRRSSPASIAIFGGVIALLFVIGWAAMRSRTTQASASAPSTPAVESATVALTPKDLPPPPQAIPPIDVSALPSTPTITARPPSTAHATSRHHATTPTAAPSPATASTHPLKPGSEYDQFGERK